MKRWVPLLLIVAYMVVLAVPVVAHVTKARRQPVSGALPPAQRPPLTIAAVLDESFQHGVTTWFENHRTMFGHAVHVDNGVLYRVFGETRVGSRVRLGRDRRVLFIDEDIDYLNAREANVPSAAQLDALAERIARVQQHLRARGQALVPMIIPAKTSVYRDAVDPRWRRGFGERTVTDLAIYERLVAQLDARGVTYVDMRAAFAHTPFARADVWGPEARHWSEFGACLAVEQVVARYATLLGRPPLPYRCNLDHAPTTRLHDDYDLKRLLNVWGFQVASRQVPVARHAPPPPDLGPPPSALFVGTSFNWALIRDAVASQLLAPVHMHYYDSQIIAWPENVSVKAAAGDAAWRAIVEPKDLIVLDLLEPAMFSGHVYIDTFLTHAEQLAARPAAVRPPR